MRVLRYVPFLLLLALGVATPAAASGGGPRVSVVAKGLDSPRHLAFGSRGDLFVAEAGRGGSGPCFSAPRVTRAWAPAVRSRRSTAGAASSASRRALPRSRTARQAARDRAAWDHGVGSDGVIITNGGPTAPSLVEDGADRTRASLSRRRTRVADLFGKVLLIGQHGIGRSSSPTFGASRRPSTRTMPRQPGARLQPRRRALRRPQARRRRRRRQRARRRSTSSAASTPSRYSRTGRVPNPFGPRPPTIPMQAVPTAIVEGPDHQYYVSPAHGLPVPGRWRFRLPREPAQWSGKRRPDRQFTNIMDLAFDRDGTLYVLEIDHDSLLGPTAE